MLEYLLGFLLAIGIGVIAALIGVGGGFLYVPTLILVFGLEPRMAIGTSVSIIVFTTLSGGISYFRQKRIFIRSALCLIIPSVAFSVIGAWSTSFVDEEMLTLIFSLVLLIVSVKMLVPSLPLMTPISYGPYYDEKTTDIFSVNAKNRLYYLHTLTWGAIAGYMSGLTGIGGGTMYVPALVLGGMPIHFVIATSTFTILFTSISASLAHSKLGNISVPYLAVYSAGAFIGAQVGARIAPRVNPDLLKSAVGFILIFTAIAVLIKSAGGLL